MKYNEAVSVIILCHNNYNINICIDVVLQQIDKADEVIVVDDHSDETTWAILSDYINLPQIQILHADSVANRSRNRNLGAKQAHNPILFFIDGDMVLGNRGLHQIKLAHSNREECAFIGQKHGINFDQIQMNLYSSLPNYIDLLKTYEGRECLAENPLFKNPHVKSSCEYDKFCWIKYYTGLNTVEKSVFEEINGFDEAFTFWGSEDVDLGYRISQLGKIGYINDLHAFHIPHARNQRRNEETNLQNILYMQQKYKTWEFEILHSFYGYGDLQVFENVISRMRLLRLSDYCPEINKLDIIIDSISLQNPIGKIITNDGKPRETFGYFGISICVQNKNYDVAYLSDHIFIYPNIITCHILQEALRIAKKVYIFQTNDSIRIPWTDDKILLPKSQKQHLFLEKNDLWAFTFHASDNGYIQVYPLN